MNAIRRMLGLDGPPAPPPDAPLTPEREPVVTDPAMPGLPTSAAPRIERINSMTRDVLRRMGDDPLMATRVVEMQQLRDVHLPKLVRSYVEIPAQHRQQIFIDTGKSASVHLGASLDAMIARIEAIDRDLSRENLSTFTDNTRFIAARYGDDDNPFA